MSEPDEPDEPDEPRLPGSRAAYASNWTTVLVVVALVGVVVLAVGIAVMVLWNLYVGAFIGSVGLVYDLLVLRRGLQWRWLRRDAGL